MTMTAQRVQPTSEVVAKKISWVNVLGTLIFSTLLIPVILHVFFNTSFSPVVSTSMEPEYSMGSLVFTKETVASQIHLGDIVILREATTHKLFGHSVAKITQSNGLLQMNTKGRENLKFDPGFIQISPDSTLPRVTGSLPYAGTFIAFLSSKTGKLLSGFALLLSAVLYFIRFWHRRLTLKHMQESTTEQGTSNEN